MCLQKTLPLLRQSMLSNNMQIEGLRAHPLSAIQLGGGSGSVQAHTVTRLTTVAEGGSWDRTLKPSTSTTQVATTSSFFFPSHSHTVMAASFGAAQGEGI